MDGFRNKDFGTLPYYVYVGVGRRSTNYYVFTVDSGENLFRSSCRAIKIIKEKLIFLSQVDQKGFSGILARVVSVTPWTCLLMRLRHCRL